MVLMKRFVLVLIALSASVALVAARSFLVGQEFELIPGGGDGSEEESLGDDADDGKSHESRGLLDVLENFRLWQIERNKLKPSTLPTPEPTGLDYLLPRFPEIRLDRDTLNAIIKIAEDLSRSFVGPPPTEPDLFDYNATNISTTIPPNDFFCLFCNI